MTIHQRLRALRRALDLTQAEFGSRINLTQGFLTSLETGKRGLTNRTIADICREFHASEQWLREGVGDMLTTPTEDTWDDIREEFGLTGNDVAILSRYARLDAAGRAAIRRLIISMANDMNLDQEGIEDALRGTPRHDETVNEEPINYEEDDEDEEPAYI